MGTHTGTLNVFATSEQGTLAALQHAASLARSTRASVVVLVPKIVDYGIAMETNGARPDDLAASYRDLASRVGLDVAVRICPCRDAKHMAGRMMLQPARIVLGGRWRQWPATTEQRLARALACDGHEVTFVEVTTGAVHLQRYVPPPVIHP